MSLITSGLSKNVSSSSEALPGFDRGTICKVIERKPLASRPELYLAYLVFYFIPWAFRAPRSIDIIVAVIAVSVFVVLHYRSFAKTNIDNLFYVFAIEALAFATMPFHAGNGVFHIYACALAGFQRPLRNAVLTIGVLTVVFLTISYFYGDSLSQLAFIFLISVLASVGCIASVEQIERSDFLERSRVIDQQLAAIGERERIARDMHDLLGQTLTTVTLKAEVVERLLEKDPERARAELADLRAASRSALQDVRRIVSGMQLTTIAKETESAKLALAAANIKIDIELERDLMLPATLDAVFGLTLREAVTNVIRHSDADRMWVKLFRRDENIHLKIFDNGNPSLVIEEGNGLSGIRTRIESHGGQVLYSTNEGMQISALVTFPQTASQIEHVK